MGNVAITLSGIHQAVDNLNYRPGTVKYKAVQAILSFYTSEESLNEIHTIDTDILIDQELVAVVENHDFALLPFLNLF